MIRLRTASVMVLTMAAMSSGQDVVRVTKNYAAKTAIDLSGLSCDATPAAALFRRTLESDINRSGWFVIAPPGGGAFKVQGRCDTSGPNISFRCEVLHAVTLENRLSKAFTATASQARQLAHRAADEIVLALTGFPGIASTRVALIGNGTGHKELYVCDADGENLRQVTRDGSISIGPSWDPQGRQVVYTSFRGGFPDVYLVDLDTGSRRVLARYPGVNIAGGFSPDGQDVALTLSKDGNPDIYIASVAGGKLTRLTTTAPAAEASPTWSPDGSQIAFVSDTSGSPHLYIMSRSGGERRRLTTRGSENVAPDWGPNGLIAYSSKRGPRYEICVIDPVKMEDRQITTGDADYEDPSWARDGRHIVCARKANYRSAVYILDTLGDNPIPLLKITGDWFSPAWSPK